MPEYIFKNAWLNELDWDNVPTMSEDSANWLHTLTWSWPKDGRQFAEAVGLFELDRAAQREFIDMLVDSPRGQLMPQGVREYLVSLGLLDA